MSIGYMMDGWQTESYFDRIKRDKEYKKYVTSTSGTSSSGIIDNSGVPQTNSIKAINPPAAPVGWICPKCGAGIAPWVSRCPCQDKWEVTC